MGKEISEMIYGIVLLVILIEILLIPSEKEKSNFFTRVSIGVSLIMSLNILEAIICFWLRVEVVTNMLAMNLLMGMLLTIYLLKKKQIQKYTIKLCDIIFVISIVIIISGIAIVNFGIPFEIKYQSTDASTHFSAALNFIKERIISKNSK